MMATRPERRDRAGLSTIEVLHRGARVGVVIETSVTSPARLRVLLEATFDLAGRQSRRLVTDPGWWAACVAATAISAGQSCSIQRVVDRAELHARLLVERGTLLGEYPAWPMATLMDGGAEIDLRGEAALRHGPSDAELAEYRTTLPLAPGEPRVSIAELRRMFELGVLGFEPGPVKRGRRRIIHAAH